MMERIKNMMDETFTFRGREVALGMACCALLGLVAGMLMAPPKEITIASNNDITAGIPEEIPEIADEETDEE
jgi:hypothetical protein